MTDQPDRRPCRCMACSTSLDPDGVAVIRADTVSRLIEYVADGLHKIECTNCAWAALTKDAMHLDVLAEALEMTHHNPDGATS